MYLILSIEFRSCIASQITIITHLKVSNNSDFEKFKITNALSMAHFKQQLTRTFVFEKNV